MATTDLDDLKVRAQALARALAEPAIGMPAPQVPTPYSWLFTVVRDEQGRVSSVLAEPVI